MKASVPVWVHSTLVNTPSPAGINPPVSEKPSTRPDALVDARNPALWADPPEALPNEAPRISSAKILNWKP